MLAQVTYIPKFTMADSEDEFMLIVVAASAAFVANNPKYLPAGRWAPGRCHDFCPADAPRRPTMTGRSKIGLSYGSGILIIC